MLNKNKYTTSIGIRNIFELMDGTHGQVGYYCARLGKQQRASARAKKLRFLGPAGVGVGPWMPVTLCASLSVWAPRPPACPATARARARRRPATWACRGTGQRRMDRWLHRPNPVQIWRALKFRYDTRVCRRACRGCRFEQFAIVDPRQQCAESKQMWSGRFVLR